MLTKLTSRRTALWLFGIAAVFIGFTYILLIFTPTEQGRAGIYILPIFDTLIDVFILMWVLLFVSIVIYLIRTHSATKIGPLVLIAFLLFLAPFLAPHSVSRLLLQTHITTTATSDHVYHLSQNIFSTCDDGDLFSKSKCSYVFLYQCDRLGLICTLKKGDVFVKHEQPLNLRLENNQIQVTSDQDKVVYTFPL
jgi:hypothetical protein